MEGLDETYDLQDDNYYLKQVKLRDMKIRTAAKFSTRALHGEKRCIQLRIDSEACAVCSGSEPPGEAAVVDWVQCDHFHAWLHWACIGYAQHQKTLICPMCHQVSLVDTSN